MKKTFVTFVMTNGNRLCVNKDFIVTFYDNGTGNRSTRICTRNNNFDVQETYDQVVEIVTYGNRFTKREA